MSALNHSMSEAWRRTEALKVCGDRLVPTWRVKQQQRKRQIWARIVVRSFMLAVMAGLLIWSFAQLMERG